MNLLRNPAADASRSLDAIIVSAFRPAANLRSAMRLAAGGRLRLVVLCSGSANPQSVLHLASTMDGLRYAVVEIPAGYGRAMADLRTTLVARTRGGLGELSVQHHVS